MIMTSCCGYQPGFMSSAHVPRLLLCYRTKKGLQESRTVSRLEEVSGDTQVSELMRMLGTSGASAMAHARELLEI